ncbi:hypothetical protein C5167_019146 [Papaver somniferum]|uniref:Uncharacterized protein n=1 Tax=Papaver somniferum TaxID=3469 RepID=A0A4Y7IPY0_PAPSO|nr:hypothetical protein C5167_019146 [Papaver somniferum]
MEKEKSLKLLWRLKIGMRLLNILKGVHWGFTRPMFVREETENDQVPDSDRRFIGGLQKTHCSIIQSIVVLYEYNHHKTEGYWDVFVWSTGTIESYNRNQKITRHQKKKGKKELDSPTLQTKRDTSTKGWECVSVKNSDLAGMSIMHEDCIRYLRLSFLNSNCKLVRAFTWIVKPLFPCVHRKVCLISRWLALLVNASASLSASPGSPMVPWFHVHQSSPSVPSGSFSIRMYTS